MIYKKENETNKRFIYSIGRGSCNTSGDMGDAIEFNDKEIALMLAKSLSKRDRENYRVLSITTTIEEVMEEN